MPGIILLTGGSGFFGRRIAERAAQAQLRSHRPRPAQV